MISLRPYQSHTIEAIRSLIRAGRKRILLVEPTGAGKGTQAAYMIQGAVERGRRVLFLVNRRELVKDMSRRLDRLGLDHGVIMSDHPRRKPWLGVHIASIDTLHRRPQVPKADLLFCDEAHFSVSPVWQRTIERFPEAVLISMTATPVRSSGEGLGTIYTDMVLGPSTAELIAQGYLVPARVFAPSTLDVSGLDISGGDVNNKQLAAISDKPKIVGDLVAHWKRLASDRKTVVFAVDKAHAHHIAEAYRAAGIDAACVVDDTPDAERDRVWDDLDNGQLRIVVSVGVISYGWDHPIVSCVQQARRTLSLALDLQQLGRGLRPAPGKADLLILDHVGNTAQHGFVDDPREWSLQGAGKISKKDVDAKALSVCMCRECWCAFHSRLPKCPACGAPRPKSEREIQQVAGELQEVQRERKLRAIEDWRERTSAEEKRARYLDLVRLQQERGYKRGFAEMRFKILFGHFPPKGWRQSGGMEATA